MSTELALMPTASEWTQMCQMGGALVKSSFLPTAVNTPEKAVAIILKGRELAIPPMQALSQIHVIQGKPTISSELMLALIYRNVPGAKIEFERLDNDGCTIKATRPQHQPVVITFDRDDAKAAGLLAKDNWSKYPRAMFRSRAIAEMARTQFPDAIMGCSYTPEELGAHVDEDGDVLQVVATTTTTRAVEDEPPPPPQPDPEPTPIVKPAAPKVTGYNGSTAHQQALQKALVTKGVPEEVWHEVDEEMMGRSFTELEGVLKTLREKRA